MTIHTVISFDENAREVRAKVVKHYEDHYIPHEKRDITFIRSEEPAVDIAKKLGFDKEGKAMGVVIKHELWKGWGEAGLKEWSGKQS